LRCSPPGLFPDQIVSRATLGEYGCGITATAGFRLHNRGILAQLREGDSCSAERGGFLLSCERGILAQLREGDSCSAERGGFLLS